MNKQHLSDRNVYALVFSGGRFTTESYRYAKCWCDVCGSDMTVHRSIDHDMFVCPFREMKWHTRVEFLMHKAKTEHSQKRNKQNCIAKIKEIMYNQIKNAV